MNTSFRQLSSRSLAVASWLALGTAASGQLLQSLQSFSNSVSLVDSTLQAPEEIYQTDGPKELVSADFDQDGHPDLAASKVMGRVAVVFGVGGKRFSIPRFLDAPADTGELRGITAGDFTGDGLPDIAVAAPMSGRVVIFAAAEGRTFSPPAVLNAWLGARNLIAADVDGDGRLDLVVAGPEPAPETMTTTSAILRAYYNHPAGWIASPPLSVTGSVAWEEEFPRPTFTFSVLPPMAGQAGQRVVVTHASSAEAWVVRGRPVADPGLVIDQALPVLLPTQSLTTGQVLSQNGQPDLITAARDENQVLVRAGLADGTFSPTVTQRIFIPGNPRALALTDTDADGWNDLIVVLREFDRVVTFHNEQGTLKLVAESPVGSSPRDLVAADFNNDGRADMAVSNRDSDNISILITQAGSAVFERLDTVYSVDGGVSALALEDVNGDGRDDVIQTHLLTKEISVRLSQAGGLLGPAIYTGLASPPVALRTGDFNSDQRADVIIVHSADWAPGLTILTGQGDGTFGAPAFLPSEGGLFAIIMADLDKDGVQDAIAGFYDCRLVTYKGWPNGTFEKRRMGLFNYESRAMAVGDFDQDGDLDIAGASAVGELTIVENDGRLLEVDETFKRTVFKGGSKSRIKSMVLMETNGDNDPDIAINSEEGVSLYESRAGLGFAPVSGVLPGTKGASDLALGDFDGDGRHDLAAACRVLSCVTILKGEPDGSFAFAAAAPVPSADMIAVGDIDGDGQADIAGSGEILWTALSGRRPQSSSGRLAPARPPLDEVVINELIASNLSVRFVDGSTATPDAVELYNGKTVPVSLAGWELVYTPLKPDEAPTPVTMTLGDKSLAPDSRLTIVCDGLGLGGSAPFKLAKEGGRLELRSGPAATRDTITYGPQDPDVSYGRYVDGSKNWAFKDKPDLNQPNYMPADGEGPRFRQVSMVPSSLNAGRRARFWVKATDDVGIFTLSAIWKWLDAPLGTPAELKSGRIGLFDDGEHSDGTALDGTFSAELPSLPAGATVEFFFDATNLVDQSRIYPGDPAFSLAGQPITNYAIKIPADGSLPPVEISELQTHSSQPDETGTPSDFVEIRNTGAAAVSLTGLALRDGLFSSVRTLPLTGTLAPGEHRIYFADAPVDPKPGHLPFKLNKSGEAVWLTAVDPQGAVTLVDHADSNVPTPGIDSWARLGPGGPFAALAPTPRTHNLRPSAVHIEWIRSPRSIRLAFPTAAGRPYLIQSMVPQEGPLWSIVWQLTGNGFESWVDLPIDPSQHSGFYRLK